MAFDAVHVQAVSVGVTIFVAFCGYLVTYVNNVRIERRKGQLQFVSDQIRYLYGPLYSVNNASKLAWGAFRSEWRPGQPFFGMLPAPTENDLRQWHLWMTEVFMPLNLKMEQAIIENSHLLDGAKMPSSFEEFLAHVETYKPVIKRWEQGDFEENTAYLNFPEDFGPDIDRAYNRLRTQQANLLGLLHTGAMPSSLTEEPVIRVRADLKAGRSTTLNDA